MHTPCQEEPSNVRSGRTGGGRDISWIAGIEGPQVWLMIIGKRNENKKNGCVMREGHRWGAGGQRGQKIRLLPLPAPSPPSICGVVVADILISDS